VKPVLFLPVVLHLFADEPIMDIPDLSEGEETNLTCSAPFPCPGAPPDNITLTTSKNLYLSTLTLTPSSDLHDGTVGCDVSYGSKNISTRRTLEVKCEFPMNESFSPGSNKITPNNTRNTTGNTEHLHTAETAEKN
uniref:Ig-like domain-containing protein n=1 Tax=Cyprinus carpio TaxID=7962 RepID=A0A8C2E9F1_CYPCA